MRRTWSTILALILSLLLVLNAAAEIVGGESEEMIWSFDDDQQILIADGELQGEDNGDGTHTVTMTGESGTEPTDEGDKLQSEDPENYDQTTTTDTRQVEVTVSEPTVSTGTIIYLDENGRCKVEIGLARGKKLYDKREAQAKRDAERKMDKAIKDSRRR